VHGRSLPDHVAGHVALELCNTKALWGLAVEKEYLTDFTALLLWAQEHQLVSAVEADALRAEPVARQRAALRDVRGLRAALYATVTGVDARLPELGRYVSRAVGRSSYVETDGTVRFRAPLSPTVLVDRAALEADRLMSQYGPAAVGLCASSACGWVFLDPSHRRRWCIMAICGNRAKARRYADRRRPAAAPAHSQ
jgi:predicted RNA-binding Zn ribbon-like protein